MTLSMPLKFAGVAALFFSSLLFGLTKIREQRRRLTETKAVAALVHQIRTEIEAFRRPLPEIYAVYRSDVLEDNGFLPRLRSGGLTEAIPALAHLPDVAAILIPLAERLGQGDAAEEVGRCRIAEEGLLALSVSYEKDSASVEKLYRTIPVMMAASAALILL